MVLYIYIISALVILVWIYVDYYKYYSILLLKKGKYAPVAPYNIESYIYTESLDDQKNNIKTYMNLNTNIFFDLPLLLGRFTLNVDIQKRFIHHNSCFTKYVNNLVHKKRYNGFISIKNVNGLCSSKSSLYKFNNFIDFHFANSNRIYYPITDDQSFKKTMNIIELRNTYEVFISYADINRIYFSNSDASHRFAAAYCYAIYNNIDYIFNRSIIEYKINRESLSYLKDNWHMFILPSCKNFYFFNKFIGSHLKGFPCATIDVPNSIYNEKHGETARVFCFQKGHPISKFIYNHFSRRKIPQFLDYLNSYSIAS